MKIALGLLLAFTIGVICRLAYIPLPAPPVLIGALVVLSMTLGYTAIDRLASHREAKHRHLCGGPTGASTEPENRS
jgi:XapX domain-containing protein